MIGSARTGIGRRVGSSFRGLDGPAQPKVTQHIIKVRHHHQHCDTLSVLMVVIIIDHHQPCDTDNISSSRQARIPGNTTSTLTRCKTKTDMLWVQGYNAT